LYQIIVNTMIKTSIGELKLSPLKEEGKFVFYNDFVTINSKVSKGDRITLMVDGYEMVNSLHYIKRVNTPDIILIVRGEKHELKDTLDCATVEDLYNQASDIYKNRFYFAGKV
jgi:hypothetical protein